MLGVDGLMGPKTRKALVGYMEKRRDQDGEEVLIRSINGSQLDHYKRLADAKPHRFGAFIYGWVRHRIEME